MSVDKFKFVSPGVFVDEIDESGIPKLPERMGPLVVGRFQKGPGGRPVKVDSYKEFVRIFGEPAPGNASGDIWRSGEMTAPTYAAYAVKAWLRNNSPCTVYRALGNQSSNAASGIPAQAGWQAGATLGGFDTTDIGGVGGAYGLFVIPNPDNHRGAAAAGSFVVGNEGFIENGDTVTLTAADGTVVVLTLTDASAATSEATSGAALSAQHNAANVNAQATLIATAINHHTLFEASADGATVNITQSVGGSSGNTAITCVDGGGAGPWFNSVVNFTGGTDNPVTGTLAAIWYAEQGAVILTGTARAGDQREGLGVEIQSNSGLQFTAKVLNGEASVVKTATFNFNRDSDLFIRKVFNTDPTKTNSTIVPNAADVETHWLGETFESNLFAGENSKFAVTGTALPDNSNFLAWIAPLDGNTASNIVWGDHKNASQQPRAAQTGWFISQDNRGGSPTQRRLAKPAGLRSLASGLGESPSYHVAIRALCSSSAHSLSKLRFSVVYLPALIPFCCSRSRISARSN